MNGKLSRLYEPVVNELVEELHIGLHMGCNPFDSDKLDSGLVVESVGVPLLGY